MNFVGGFLFEEYSKKVALQESTPIQFSLPIHFEFQK